MVEVSIGISKEELVHALLALLFRVTCLSEYMICSFSLMQKRQRLVAAE